MKYYTLIIICSVCFYTAFAQHKSNFAIGIDYINYGKPKEWMDHHIQMGTLNEYLFEKRTATWASYSFKNRYSIRIYKSFLSQYGKIDPTKVPDNFLYERIARFYDATIGYNILHKQKKISCFVYAGISYVESFQDDRRTYVPGWWDTIGGGHFKWHIYRPTAQVLFKYNPIRWVFVGVGGTYHYIYKDAQPLSLNLSLGLQI